MNDDDECARSPSDEEVERDIRSQRKFSAKEALARLAGPGAMKGASPVSPQRQAAAAVGTWIRSEVPDSSGALQAVLERQVCASNSLLEQPDLPLDAIHDVCTKIVASDALLQEFVRQADAEWGQRMGERPYFEAGRDPHPDDPYTLESVRELLEGVVCKLNSPRGGA